MVSDMNLRFTKDEITPWGGLSVLFKMLEKCGMRSVLEHCPLPAQGSNRGYDPIQLIYGLFAGVWCGASNFRHLEIIRYDSCLRKFHLDLRMIVNFRLRPWNTSASGGFISFYPNFHAQNYF